MRDDNTEPRDNQQITDDNQQSGVAEDQITNRTEEGLDEEDADEDDEFGEDEDESAD